MSQDQKIDLDRLDLDEIKRFLKRRWRLIVATAVACVLLAGIICVSVTPTYTATSQILLDPHRQHVFGQDAVGADTSVDSSIVDSQIPILLSTRLLAKVIAKEHLADDPEFAAPSKQGLLDKIFSVFRAAKVAQVKPPSGDGIDPKLEPVIRRLFDKIDVTRVQKSYVLSLAVSSRDPAKATRLANALAETYVEDQIDVHARAVSQAAEFFQDRLGDLREQVRESESAVAEYRKAHGMTPVQMDGPNPITVGEQQLQDLNEKLAQASADTAGRLAAFQQAMRFKSDGTNLESLPEIIRSPVITQLRTQQAELSRRAADLSAMYGPAFPAIVQMNAQRAGLDRAIKAEMTRLVSTFKNDYEVAKARETSLRQSIVTLSSSSSGDNETGVKLRELERINLANKALFENFLNRAKLTQEQSTFEESDARLISPALEPTTPAFPKTKIIVGVSAIVGLLLGLGLAVLLDVLRGQGKGTMTSRANAFILGRVPLIGGRRDERVDCTAYMADHPASAFSRAVAGLAVRLVSAETAGQGRAIVLAALGPDAGATSLALCLATAAGSDGRRVLLIDADHARRGLSSRLGIAGQSGFAEVIRGDLTASKAVVARPHFAVLPAGQKSFDAAASARALRGFLAEARGRFDLILVDAPAFDASMQAAALAAAADGLAIVASWDQLLREDFIAVVDAVADKPNFAGIILNRVAAHEDELALVG